MPNSFATQNRTLAAPLSSERLSSLALPCLFAFFGFLIGSWAGRIPALRDGLSIPHASLSMVLLCGGLGAVISFPLTTVLMNRLGGRHTMLASGLGMLSALLAVGCAGSVPMLMFAVLMLGLSSSCLDVAVNALATEREAESGRAHLSVMHAWFCAGSLGGAGVASLMAAGGVTPQAHFALLALPGAALLFVCQAVLREGRAVQAGESKSFTLPRGPVVILGAICFLGAMAEGSVVDWSGVFLKDHFGAPDAMTPLALAAFNSLMLAARLMGDRIKMRFGAKKPMATGAMLAATGLLFSVLAPSAHTALIGFGLAGCGLAFIFPFVFSAVGRQGSTALAGVATMAYSGSLMGPPIMGGFAQSLGIQATIAMTALLSLGIAFSALKAPGLETPIKIRRDVHRREENIRH